jgi:hypothetical protein
MAGNWFYLFMLGVPALSGWITTQQLCVGIMMLDFGLATFWGYIPEISYPVLGVLNVFMLTNALLFKPFSPSL